jgi:large subunit ribosomal protein L12
MMEYVYTALLLHKAGQPINEKNMDAVLTAAGVKSDKSRVKALLTALEGVDIDEVLKSAVAVAAPAAPAAAGPAAAREKKEEKEEKKEEEFTAGLGSLFG